MKSRILSFLSAFALFTLMACGDSSSPDQGPPNQTPHTQQQQPVSPVDQQITQLGTLGDLTAEQIRTILANGANIKAELLRRLTAHNLETLNQLLNQTQGITPAQTYVSAFLAMYTVDYAAAWAAARNAAGIAASNAVGATPSNSAGVAGRHAPWAAPSNAAGAAAWNAAWAAAWNAAGDAARNAAWHAAWTSARAAARDAAGDAAWEATRDAASDAARPLITVGLGVLHLEDSQEIGRTAYALSEVLTLNWLLQNNRIYFENAFNAARVALGAEVDLEQARGIVDRRIGRERLNNNPFIVQMRSFMTSVEQRITPLSVQ